MIRHHDHSISQMSSTDPFTALSAMINVLIGAGAAYLGGSLQARHNERLQKTRIQIEKLERAHMLAQQIYDGHKREIGKARKYLPADPHAFSSARQHPGMEMSELKMLITIYLPSLKGSLEPIKAEHASLKTSFKTVDDQVLGEVQLYKADCLQTFRAWEQNLEDLGKGCDALKRGLEAELQRLTSLEVSLLLRPLSLRGLANLFRIKHPA